MKSPIKVDDIPIGTILENPKTCIAIVTNVNQCKVLVSYQSYFKLHELIYISYNVYLPEGINILTPEEANLLKLALL